RNAKGLNGHEPRIQSICHFLSFSRVSETTARANSRRPRTLCAERPSRRFLRLESFVKTALLRHGLQKLHQARRKLLIPVLIAETTVRGYLLLRPTDAELLQKAIRHADRGEREAAILLFDQLLKRNPSKGMALLYRGQLARDLGDAAAAAEFWGRVP